MKTNPLTGARYPELTVDAPNGAQQIQYAVDDLSPLARPIFASTTARDSAFTTWTSAGHTLSEGLRCYTQAENVEWFYDGTQWTWPRGAQGTLAYIDYAAAGGSPIVLNTADTTLTIYSLPTFTVPANRRLRVVHHVTLSSTAGATSAYGFHYRLAGTLFRSAVCGIPFVDVPDTRTVSFEMQPAAGSVALTISGYRHAGTGTPQLLCDSGGTYGPTQFFVEDIGPAS